MEMSQLTSMAVRTQSALDKYELVTEKAEEAVFVDSLSSGHRVIRDEVKQNTVDVKKETQLLNRRLEELKQDLDVGKVLASMSLVEASQAGKEFSSQLSDNARNIASAIERIEIHVVAALSLLKKAEKTL